MEFTTSSHDLPVSDALAAFMAGDWADTSVVAAPSPTADLTAARRAKLSARFPGQRLVIPSGVLKVRSYDTDHRFRPHTAYAYLTGEQEPDGVLVLEPRADGHESVLYLRPRSVRTTGEFFRDRRYGEFWVGRRPTLDEASAQLGLACEHLDDLPKRLGDGVPTELLGGVDPALDALLPGAASVALASYVSEMRLLKDPWEVAQLQLAVDSTTAGFRDVVQALPEALRHSRGERWIEGVFGLRARAEGNGVGYETIAASGAHACVLHWIRNDGRLNRDELLLLDAGVETDSLYTSDVTRTLPLSGRFSPVQRQVYELVLAAQQAGIDTLKPGASFRDFHRAAMRVIAEGLYDWGVLSVKPDVAMRPDNGLFRRYTLCSSGHMLGMDVHDCAQARAETYLDGVLEAGHVLTVEPGLYLQPDDLTLPPELRGIGVRIEDDLLITEDGAVMLSGALPRDPDAIEEWMSGLL